MREVRSYQSGAHNHASSAAYIHPPTYVASEESPDLPPLSEQPDLFFFSVVVAAVVVSFWTPFPVYYIQVNKRGYVLQQELLTPLLLANGMRELHDAWR